MTREDVKKLGDTSQVSYGLKKIEPEPSEKPPTTDKVAVRCKVFVGNLHEGTSRTDLMTKFQQYGTVVDVKVCTPLLALPGEVYLCGFSVG
jgi:hypothetical protein